jgi:hypothetical protein
MQRLCPNAETKIAQMPKLDRRSDISDVRMNQDKLQDIRTNSVNPIGLGTLLPPHPGHHKPFGCRAVGIAILTAVELLAGLKLLETKMSRRCDLLGHLQPAASIFLSGVSPPFAGEELADLPASPSPASPSARFRTR